MTDSANPSYIPLVEGELDPKIEGLLRAPLPVLARAIDRVLVIGDSKPPAGIRPIYLLFVDTPKLLWSFERAHLESVRERALRGGVLLACDEIVEVSVAANIATPAAKAAQSDHPIESVNRDLRDCIDRARCRRGPCIDPLGPRVYAQVLLDGTGDWSLSDTQMQRAVSDSDAGSLLVPHALRVPLTPNQWTDVAGYFEGVCDAF